MDAYEATKVVFSRVQALDPDNAANIMGMLLIQDHGEKDMIRLAFGPEALLHSVVLKARKDLGLLPPCSPPSVFPRQTLPSPTLPLSGQLSPASSWPAPTPVFSRANSGIDGDQLRGASYMSYDMGAGFNSSGASYSTDDCSLGDSSTHDQLNDFCCSHPPASPNSNNDGTVLFPHCRRSSSTADDMYYISSEASWRPCLYYARGYCKNGSSCRFQHADLQADDYPVDHMKADTEDQLSLRTTNSPRQMSMTHMMASAAPFPYGANSVPSPTSAAKGINFLIRQQNENQRAAAAALMLGPDLAGAVDVNRFMGGRSPRLVDRADYSCTNPGSRQIYLTFPADSTFREEDVSNYFSIYGPVADVRIPYQQKRMFGFVTFLYSETVRLILAKGNPHFVCDARVLVKPYKEKGKVPDKKHQYLQQLDRGDFSGCPSPTGLDARDTFDLRQLGPRMLFNANPEALLRRKLEEDHQAAELQQAIELQSRRFVGLQLLDLKNRPSLSSHNEQAIQIVCSAAATTSVAGPEEPAASEDKRSCPPVTGGADQLQATDDSAARGPVDAKDKEGEEAAGGADDKRSPDKDGDFQESADHNLPDSPFASAAESHSFSAESVDLRGASHLTASSPSFFPLSPTPDMASRKLTCFLDLSRFPSSHGAVRM